MALLSRQHECIWFVFHSYHVDTDPIFSSHDHQPFSTNDAAEACSGLLRVRVYSQLLTFHKSHLNNWVLIGVSESYIGFVNINIEIEAERNTLQFCGLSQGAFLSLCRIFPCWLSSRLVLTSCHKCANVKDVLSYYFILVLPLICTYIPPSSLSLHSSY